MMAGFDRLSTAATQGHFRRSLLKIFMANRARDRSTRPMVPAALAKARVALWDGAPKTHLLVFLALLKIGIEAVLPMELASLRRDLLNQINSMKHH